MTVREYTRLEVLTRGVEEGWADPETDPALIDWDKRLAAAAIPFDISADRRPLSPFPPEVVARGRNGFGRWGENLMAHALVTACVGVRHVLLVQPGCQMAWKLPGGHVQVGETGPEAALRELAEKTGVVITDPALCRPWPARHVDDPRASDEAWAVSVPVWADLGEVAVLPEVGGGGQAVAAWIPARDYPYLLATLKADHQDGRVFKAHEDMLRQLLGPWHAHSCVIASCTRCGITAKDQVAGGELHFGDSAEAARWLPVYGWRVIPGAGPGAADEVLCGECGRKDECGRLGHRTVVDDAQRMADGSVVGAVTWCDRCGELLAREPGTPAPDGYPAPEVIHTYLSWDAAALPAGDDLADAATYVLARLSDDAAIARWDAFDGPQDGRPAPAEPDPEADAAAALALIHAGTRLLESLRASGSLGTEGDPWTPYGCLVGMESSSEGHESAEDLAGTPGRGEAHDLAALAAVVYGEEEDGEYVDKHDEWLAATRDWTFDEIRSVLYEEASDSALMGGGLMCVAGWCRCGDHADLIEGFLSDYGLRYDEEGRVVDMLEEEEDDGDRPRLGGAPCEYSGM